MGPDTGSTVFSVDSALAAAPAPARKPRSEFPDAYWRSLQFFNGYRLAVAAVLLAAGGMFGESKFLGIYDRTAYLYANAAYVLFAALCFLPTRTRRPDLDWQLSIQVAADVVFVVALMHASGGTSSGIGLLLLAVLAGAGLISRGRLTLFHAALASIGVLLEHTYQVLAHDASVTQYVQTGFLAIGYFATAWVAHVFARYAVQSEQLAAQREIDLANMAQVNQLIIQDMDAGVVVIDSDGKIRSRNAKADALLGPLHADEMEISLHERAPALAGRIARWRASAPAGAEPTTTLIGGKPVSVRYVPVGQGGRVGAVLFLEDLTRVQTQARQMKLASLGRLTANIAHEIRNPLSAISHATELLQEEGEVNETSTRLLRIIHDNTQRLDRMVQDVLRLNRRDSAHNEQFRIAEFLRTFAEQFCSIERIDPPVIRIDLAVDVVVQFDRSHLNQVMWNLCRNALRYCRRRTGSIRIWVDRGAWADRVRLSVIDDGSGVSAEYRAHLFEPFFTTEATGTGLGLYIAREVCEANQAALEYVESHTGGHFCIEFRRIEAG